MKIEIFEYTYGKGLVHITSHQIKRYGGNNCQEIGCDANFKYNEVLKFMEEYIERKNLSIISIAHEYPDYEISDRKDIFYMAEE